MSTDGDAPAPAAGERAELLTPGVSDAAPLAPGLTCGRPPAVCVFCASGPVGDAHIALAGRVGTAIAVRGWSLVSGGGRISMMGAVARAAREAGAATLGVIPEALVAQEVADDASDELVVVPDMRTRKGVMDARCDAVLALPGGLGTLEELLEAWTSHSLGMHHKPVVVLDPEGHYDPLFAWLEALRGTGFVTDRGMAGVVRTDDLDAALDAIAAGLAATPVAS